MPASPTRHRVALVLALVGVAVSILTLHVTQQLESVSGYTSFCNLGGVVNCDAVLTSRWSSSWACRCRCGRSPSSPWARCARCPGAIGRHDRRSRRPGALALASGSLGFGLVLAGISSMVLRTACLLCLSLYAVILGLVLHGAPTRPPVPGLRPRGRRAAPVAARAAIAAGLLAAVGAGALAAVRDAEDGRLRGRGEGRATRSSSRCTPSCRSWTRRKRSVRRRT